MRRVDREVTDRLQIKSIIEQAKIVHIGMVDENRPYVVPMQYGFEFTDGKLTLYTFTAQKKAANSTLLKKIRMFLLNLKRMRKLFPAAKFHVSTVQNIQALWGTVLQSSLKM